MSETPVGRNLELTPENRMHVLEVITHAAQAAHLDITPTGTNAGYTIQMKRTGMLSPEERTQVQFLDKLARHAFIGMEDPGIVALREVARGSFQSNLSEDQELGFMGGVDNPEATAMRQRVFKQIQEKSDPQGYAMSGLLSSLRGVPIPDEELDAILKFALELVLSNPGPATLELLAKMGASLTGRSGPVHNQWLAILDHNTNAYEQSLTDNLDQRLSRMTEHPDSLNMNELNYFFGMAESVNLSHRAIYQLLATQIGSGSIEIIQENIANKTGNPRTTRAALDFSAVRRMVFRRGIVMPMTGDGLNQYEDFLGTLAQAQIILEGGSTDAETEMTFAQALRVVYITRHGINCTDGIIEGAGRSLVGVPLEQDGGMRREMDDFADTLEQQNGAVLLPYGLRANILASLSLDDSEEAWTMRGIAIDALRGLDRGDRKSELKRQIITQGVLESITGMLTPRANALRTEIMRAGSDSDFAPRTPEAVLDSVNNAFVGSLTSLQPHLRSVA
ncbi:hypothetical protein KBD59_02225 [Candidatus Gracilibacteria bacterium]|nr:hypothetical protein [Candidatus Gracilibacteria bacterium]